MIFLTTWSTKLALQPTMQPATQENDWANPAVGLSDESEIWQHDLQGSTERPWAGSRE